MRYFTPPPMRMLAFARVCLLIALFASHPDAFAQDTATSSRTLDAYNRGGHRPRLVIVISIDQFRADLLTRLTPAFLPPKLADGTLGGFRYLLENGASFVDARYQHLPLETGPGHAVILTGGYPTKTGIVANDWWDYSSSTAIYCVDDPTARVVGARASSKAKPMGPRNLRSTTVGDELKAARSASRVVSIAVKDRASILLGGHAADVAIWFDETAGNWISSSVYCRDGALPSWVERINAQKIPERTLGTKWTTTLPADLRSDAQPRREPAYPAWGMGESFPHTIGAEPTTNHFKAFRLTPDANRYTLATAQEAIVAERLGVDDVPDLLSLSLSANDYAGHAFGINSAEVYDVTIETDRALSAFFDFVNRTVPGGLDNVVIAITGDHGAALIPETARDMNITAGRIFRREIMRTANDALVGTLGAGDWLATRRHPYNIDSVNVDIAEGGYIDPYLYLNDSLINRMTGVGKTYTRAHVEEIAAQAIEKLPGIHACYTRTQIENGMLPPIELARNVANAYHPKVSGDVLVVTEQMYLLQDRPNQYTSSHGTPYAYDAHVPVLIAGGGITHGVFTRRVSPADIAPTISAMFGIEFPSGCDGEILHEALR